jgi:murein L,D-transpeptidase YafK
MIRLAGVFSGLVLLAMVIAVALMIWLRPGPWPLPPLSGKADLIIVEKSARRMQVMQGGQVMREYRIALGFSPQGIKAEQGDGRTPEGLFRIDRRNGSSAYHLSLGIDYPRRSDRAAAAARGVSPGGDIFFHGQPNSLPDTVKLPGDWTAGCIALTNTEMREIWNVVDIGTVVDIRP